MQTTSTLRKFFLIERFSFLRLPLLFFCIILNRILSIAGTAEGIGDFPGHGEVIP